MPTVLTLGPYRFHFHSNENREPPHIHIDFEGNDVKFWLEPVVLAKNHGFPTHRLVDVERLVRVYVDLFKEKYHEFHRN